VDDPKNENRVGFLTIDPTQTATSA